MSSLKENVFFSRRHRNSSCPLNSKVELYSSAATHIFIHNGYVSSNLNINVHISLRSLKYAINTTLCHIIIFVSRREKRQCRHKVVIFIYTESFTKYQLFRISFTTANIYSIGADLQRFYSLQMLICRKLFSHRVSRT